MLYKILYEYFYISIHNTPSIHGRNTDKKENKVFLIYKDILMGSGAKSYMRKGFLIYEEVHKYFHLILYEEVVSNIGLCIPSL